MEIFGINISTIPWPMFLLLVVVIFAYVWYVNIFVPMEEENSNLKKDKRHTKDDPYSIDNQIDALTKLIEDTKTSIDKDSLINKTKIDNIVHDVEKYENTLNQLSMFLNSKDAVIEAKISSIKTQLDDLSAHVNNILTNMEKKSKW